MSSGSSSPGMGLISGGPQAPTSANVGATLRQVGDPLGLKGGNTFSSYRAGGRPNNGRPGQLTDQFDPAGVEARAFQAANPVVNYGDPNGQMSAHGRWLQQQQAAQGITPPAQYAPNQYGTPGNVAPTPYGYTDQQWAAVQAQRAAAPAFQMDAAPAPQGGVLGALGAPQPGAAAGGKSGGQPAAARRPSDSRPGAGARSRFVR